MRVGGKYKFNWEKQERHSHDPWWICEAITNGYAILARPSVDHENKPIMVSTTLRVDSWSKYMFEGPMTKTHVRFIHPHYNDNIWNPLGRFELEETTADGMIPVEIEVCGNTDKILEIRLGKVE